MNGEIEAAGDIATGALIAHTLEPETSGPASHVSSLCLNCGATLVGAHCHQCGQRGQIHRTLAAFFHDILHSLFHFEGKIWRTLPMLVLHPGELTRRYVRGERARFVSPLALFLFAIFLMFSVLSLSNGFAGIKATSNIDLTTKTPAQVQAELVKDNATLAKKNSDLTRLEALRAAHTPDPNDDRADRMTDLHDDIAELRRDIAELKADTKVSVSGKASAPSAQNADTNGFTIAGGNTPWEKAFKPEVEKARANPELLFLKMEQGTHKYSWIIIPLSLPFLWLVFFWRRDLKMYDHVVFITYSLTFMIFLVATFSVMNRFPALRAPGGILLMFGPPIHIFRQLKGAYVRSNIGALSRTIFLIVAAFIVLTVYAVLIVVVSLIG